MVGEGFRGSFILKRKSKREPNRGIVRVLTQIFEIKKKLIVKWMAPRCCWSFPEPVGQSVSVYSILIYIRGTCDLIINYE